MEISLAGIEEALGGLGYRETSPKARLIHAIHAIYKNSTSPDEVRAIDSDELIDIMWNLEGDRRAVRSRRKNLSSIKSSVNKDLDTAWEEGRNPEGITIGPLNTFVMSDAAKDKILNSFSGSMGLEGGRTLDRAAEALKIVSDYLSETPTDVDGEQLSNLKTLIEDFSEKFREDGKGDVGVIEKIIYRDGSEGEEEGKTEDGEDQGDRQVETGEGEAGAADVEEREADAEVDVVGWDELEELEFVEEDDLVDGVTEAADDIGEEMTVDEVDVVDAEDIEWMDEDNVIDAPDDFEATVEDEADDMEEILEDDLETEGPGEEGEKDIVELVGAEGLEEADEVELVDEDDLVEEIEDIHNVEEFQLDVKQKRLLTERFNGYLGAMERYYNQYIFIKKGNYPVGADASEEDVLNLQQVLMADYYMAKYPVTNALFEVFIEKTGYKTTAEKLGYGYVYHGRFRKVVDPNTGFNSSIWNSTYTREKVKGATWYQPLGPGSTLHKKRNHPVVQVSIKDARTFAAWTGKRLPSEIEWETAARSQAGLRYPWGNEWIEGICNFENSGISDTCPVDHFPHSINEAGLADLLGNVMEWTSDECEPKYPLETPTRYFIAKGGSWVSPEQTTLFDRSRLEADFTSNTLGFRCLAD